MQKYPVPTPPLPLGVFVPLTSPSAAVALSVGALPDAPRIVRAVLQPHPLTGGWKVRAQVGVLGVLDAEAAESYPGFQQCQRQLLSPEVFAMVTIAADNLHVGVILPPPGMEVAHGDHGGRTVLAATPHAAKLVTVDTAASEDISEADLAALSGTSHVAQLQRDGDSGSGAVVLVDDTVWGTVSLTPTLERAFDEHHELYAFAFITDDELVIVVSNEMDEARRSADFTAPPLPSPPASSHSSPDAGDEEFNDETLANEHSRPHSGTYGLHNPDGDWGVTLSAESFANDLPQNKGNGNTN
ncbi:hypothetical protein H0194_09680 [Corynebacterium incognita]|uniref:Uncharacterized protein n=1 Tax=Corynebacterium incognita TaxID=2754725 RepID=A0A7G7CNY3_9CORY|nr:hypothetical protein [Corynebacterium incognita]QNE89299.1 hypothetical protein H0194_09680 [Corynebacterium incognita]